MSNLICKTSAVQPNQAREFEIDNQQIILVNWHGAWHAYLNNCPHANWPLNIQTDVFFDADKEFLQCSNHMAMFDIETGICRAGPCTGDRLRKLKIGIIEEQIYVDLDQLNT